MDNVPLCFICQHGGRSGCLYDSRIKKCLARNDIVHEYEDGEAVVEVIDENQEYGGVFEEGI